MRWPDRSDGFTSLYQCSRRICPTLTEAEEPEDAPDEAVEAAEALVARFNSLLND